MKSQQDKAGAAAHQEKTADRKKNTWCQVPEAYGRPAVSLPCAASQNVVNMGIQAADSYLLHQYPAERLYEIVARLRSSAPARHWPDVEAGLLARLEQRLRSMQGAPNFDQDEKGQAFALGNQTMKALHELATRVSALAAVGAIVPTSAQGQEQLSQLEALAGAITWICPVEPGVKL